MPQLDKLTFSSQIFWLLISYFFLHYLFLKYVLPLLATSLKYRTSFINNLSVSKNNFAFQNTQLISEKRQLFSESLFFPRDFFLKSFLSLEKMFLLNISKLSAEKFPTILQYFFFKVGLFFKKLFLN